MTFVVEFITLAMTAIFLENLVLSRALGSSRVIRAINGGKHILWFGSLLTIITTLSSVATYFVNEFWQGTKITNEYRPFMFVVAISLVYFLVYFFFKFAFPALHKKIGEVLTLATFNCALLGSLFLAADQNFSLVKSMGFGFGSGIGFTLATLLVMEGKRRLLLCEVPKAFKGFPVTLMYLGLVALAMYGLVGHQLPF
ncbi:MAG: Rnf-Nqr domain containing protein [Hydrogenoanaerobacterium sp.]